MKQSSRLNPKLAQKILSNVLEVRCDKRALRNLQAILTEMVREDNLTRTQVMRRTRLSSSNVYPIIQKLQKKNFIEKTGSRKSERGPVAEKPVYSLTDQGYLLSAYLLQNRTLIHKFIKRLPKQDNPLLKFSLEIIEAIPDISTPGLISTSLLYNLVEEIMKTTSKGGTINLNSIVDVVLLNPLVASNARTRRKFVSSGDQKKLNQIIEKKYNELSRREQRAVFKGIKNVVEGYSFQKLRGEDYWRYLDLTEDLETIYVACPQCKKIVQIGRFPEIHSDHSC